MEEDGHSQQVGTAPGAEVPAGEILVHSNQSGFAVHRKSAPVGKGFPSGGADVGQPFLSPPGQKIGVPDVGHKEEQGLKVDVVFRKILAGKLLQDGKGPLAGRGKAGGGLPPNAGDPLLGVEAEALGVGGGVVKVL